MEVIITPSILSGSVKAIASKSYAHRLLICSALSDRKTFIRCEESSNDIEATIKCLNSLGAGVIPVQGGFEVTPITNKNLIKAAELDCFESGSTFRFLLPITCALGSEASFILKGRLSKRPISDLQAALEAHGCSFSGIGTPNVKSSGQLKNGTFTLPGNVSSQYISGLLFALPLLSGGSLIELNSELESEDYVLMTLSALRDFGIEIKTEANRFIIEGDSKYKSPADVEVEGDWSNAAFWLCAGAIGSSSIECNGLKPDSLQGDKEVLTILKKFGADVFASNNTFKIKPAALKGTEIDASKIPDLVPILAVVASVSEGKTLIKNASRLRIKESDRLSTVSETLKILGADIKETEDGIIIHGKKKLSGGTVDSYGDHRIAMMAAIASTVCENPVVIKNAEAVNKSYPEFFEDFRALGGNITEL